VGERSARAMFAIACVLVEVSEVADGLARERSGLSF
jgi:hypothetical protein